MRQGKERDVACPRKRRAAFTLTEMLMAAGILGLGLTMVASIFPVAVDQSRRSRDLTYGALCARSAAAGMRIRRDGACTYMRDKKFGFNIPDYALPSAMLLYKPNVLLKNRTYAGVSAWDGGNMVARVLLFPVSRNANGDGNGRGPWRATILVCKSQGTTIVEDLQRQWKYMKIKMHAGNYVYELRWQGYGYMVDYVTGGVAADVTAGTGYFSVGVPATTAVTVDNTIPPTATTWFCYPEVVAVYHTMLGY
jgi:hypothetical protein